MQLKQQTFGHNYLSLLGYKCLLRIRNMIPVCLFTICLVYSYCSKQNVLYLSFIDCTLMQHWRSSFRSSLYHSCPLILVVDTCMWCTQNMCSIFFTPDSKNVIIFLCTWPPYCCLEYIWLFTTYSKKVQTKFFTDSLSWACSIRFQP